MIKLPKNLVFGIESENLRQWLGKVSAMTRRIFGNESENLWQWIGEFPAVSRRIYGFCRIFQKFVRLKGSEECVWTVGHTWNKSTFCRTCLFYKNPARVINKLELPSSLHAFMSTKYSRKILSTKRWEPILFPITDTLFLVNIFLVS